MKKLNVLSLLSLALLVIGQTSANEIAMRGNIAVNERYFFDEGAAGQEQQILSLSVSPEFSYEWNDSQDQLVLSLFARIDEEDDERTHGDLREAYWLHASDDWELKVGVGKVFWGVVESQHLVDIINQTDLVEGIDGEDKLGQPMVQLSLIKDWGLVELFWLPYFRERNFPGADGRFHGAINIITDDALYESGDEEKHQDFALRWSHTFDEVDLALSYFNGTERAPSLLPVFSLNGVELIPFYAQLQQLGLEFQMTQDDWLWKLEAVSREVQDENYFALSGGFEYTFYGVLESDADIGLLLEYHFDDRSNKLLNGFDNDVFLGFRLSMNDEDSSTVLAGLSVDADNQGHGVFLEASKRLTNSITLNAELRLFDDFPENDQFSILSQDDFMEFEFLYYY